jgi:hypothetical protein
MKYYGEEKAEEFYSEESIFSLRDDDEINSAEEGFMIGYFEA